MQEYADNEILLALLRGEAIESIAANTWQHVTGLAAQHGVSELLYHRLSRQSNTFPSVRLIELHKKYLLNAARNSYFFHELAKILELFHKEYIPVIVLKGAFLAEKIYENIAARPMGDIDLLVHEDDLNQVDTLLINLGFHRQFISLERSEEEHALPYENKINGMVIEVHWVLMDDRLGMQADIHKLWERTTTDIIARNPVQVMSPEDQILHLCIHNSVHVFEMGLRGLYDLDATIRHYLTKIDWDCLDQRACQWKALRSVYINMRLVKELLHSPVPEEWLSLIIPIDYQESYFLFAKAHLFQSVEQPNQALPDAAGLVRFWGAAGWERLVILIRRVFPTPEEMARMYPAPPDSPRIFLFYPLRLLDLVNRYGRLGIKLLLRDPKTLERATHQNQVNLFKDWLIKNR